MARVAVVNLPFWGHLLPTLPLIRELARRGHEVTYFAESPFHRVIAAAGAIPEPLDIGPCFPQPACVEERITWALAQFRPVIEALLPRIDRLRPAALMHGIACAWGKCLSTITGLPSAALGGPLLFAPDRVERHLRSAWNADEAVALRASILREYRVALECSDFFVNREPVNVIFTSREFQPDAEQFGSDYRFVGPSVDDRVELQRSVFGIEGVIYVSMGTLWNDNDTLLAACAEACASLRHHVLLSTGGRSSSFQWNCPPNVTVLQWTGQASVLRHASLFVSHGGLNGVSEACWYGVPMLLVPAGHDQPAVARRVTELGAGLTLRREAANRESLRTSAKTLLEDISFRRASETIGATLQRAGGAPAAADAIEAAMGGCA